MLKYCIIKLIGYFLTQEMREEKAVLNDISYKELINNFYRMLKTKYPSDLIANERKNELISEIEKCGYLPYPYIKALNELTDAETLFCLEKKWKYEGVFKDGIFDFSAISVLARNNVTNSDWIKRECHDIKLINLSGLGDGNKKEQSVNFMDWLRQLVILPTGNLQNGIYNTTIYLTPFHPRGFGCAYIPQATCVSKFLEDKTVLNEFGLDSDKQVKMFIQFAQLAGHPVIYDILPQTGRFSKVVLTNPECVRWYDVNSLIDQICKKTDDLWSDSENKVLSQELLNKYSRENLSKAIDVYKMFLRGERRFAITEEEKEILKDIDKDKVLRKYKKTISNSIQKKSNQNILAQKVKKIVSKFVNKDFESITEDDIKDRAQLEKLLIKNGLWSMPGGAWNSSGVPVFDKMAKDGLYPIVRHYNYKGEDVTKFANLDCQSPFYFVYLENGEYNQKVIDFYIEYVKGIVKEFNFDGVRLDHVNHVVDEMSEKNGVPISYRIPRDVLKNLNEKLKKTFPHFAVIAEYMLNNDYVKEYHQDMNFDVLYGNDILLQNYKNPAVIDADNIFLAKYNKTLENISQVSVLKSYNNQDGEYRYINMYPAQLGKEGALFKWFKYKFLPGGYYAQRPIMYADGDESFSQGGLERAICNEVFMKRNDDYDFFKKFDAIDRFAKNNRIVCFGEAHILKQEDDGFVYWQLQTNDIENFIIAVANYNSHKTVVPIDNDYDKRFGVKTGQDITSKTVLLNSAYSFVSEYKFDGEDYAEEKLEIPTNELYFEKLSPAEFRFFRVEKIA